ncbi:hypothetical protein Dimus_036495, partial [Dionaea muscipula]
KKQPSMYVAHVAHSSKEEPTIIHVEAHLELTSAAGSNLKWQQAVCTVAASSKSAAHFVKLRPTEAQQQQLAAITKRSNDDPRARAEPSIRRRRAAFHHH